MSLKLTRQSLPDLSADARVEAKSWLDKHRGELPSSVADALSLSLWLAEKMVGREESRRSVFMQLKRALGIIPSSERRKNSQDPLAGVAKGEDRKGRSSAKERLTDRFAKATRLATRYRDLARRHGRKAKELKGRIMNIEDVELTAEDKVELAAEHEQFLARVATGQRCDLECAAASEKLMTGASVRVATEEVDCEVDRDALPRGAEIKQRFVETRERISFSFTVKRLDLEVEKLAIATPMGTTLVAASTDQIGPRKSKITWEFLTSMSILVAQYAMPMGRFAALASSSAKRFTAGEMSRHFRYVADRLCAVYLELGRGLANSAVLSGDDTASRVIEVAKTLAALEAGDRDTELPWEDYATSDKAVKSLQDGASKTLGLRLAAELGFEFDRKDGKGAKKGFNTTVVSGRLDAHDPKSTIVFFRSHLGGFGNLLTQILGRRRADNPDLVIQADLSTVNLISDPALRERLRLKLAGCASHARRPFAQYEADDPDLCAWMLNSFQGLAIFEKTLDLGGRNRDNTAAVRGVDERETWRAIKEAAEIIAHKWSRESELGEGARYILRHFDKLTYYLDDHRLTPSNNFSERMLRLEKLIENSALFRQTLEGRFALDIVRTVLQTAIAAKVDLDVYVNWLLRMPADVVEASPADFTPLAFAQMQAGLQQ